MALEWQCCSSALQPITQQETSSPATAANKRQPAQYQQQQQQQQLTQEEEAQAEHVTGAAGLACSLLRAAVQRIHLTAAAAAAARTLLLHRQALLRQLQAGRPQAQQRLLLQVRRLHHVDCRSKHVLPLLQAGSGAAQDELLHAAAAPRLLCLLAGGLRRLLHILRQKQRPQQILLLLLLIAVRLLGGCGRRHRRHGRRGLGRQLRNGGARAALAPHVLPDVLHLLLGHLEEMGGQAARVRHCTTSCPPRTHLRHVPPCPLPQPSHTLQPATRLTGLTRYSSAPYCTHSATVSS